jgi:hypothetical protein
MSRQRILWGAALALAGLSACQPQLEWYKADVKPSDYAADVSYCDGARQQVAAYTPDNEMHWVRLYEIDAYNNCMTSRGYRLIEPGTEAAQRGRQDATGGKK